MDNKKKFHHGDLKNALLKVTIEKIDRESVNAVSIRSVAKAAGVSHAAPVNHFEDRQALLTSVATEIFKDINKQVERKLKPKPNAAQVRLATTAQVLYRYGLKHPNRYELLWRSDLINHKDEALLAVMDVLYYGTQIDVEDKLPETGYDDDTVAVLMWSLVHGYVDLRAKGMFVDRKDKKTGKKRFNAMLSLLETKLFG